MVMSIVYQPIPINLTYSEYCINFIGNEIKTTVTNEPTIVDDWISTVQNLNRESRRSFVVGLDVEWRPTVDRQNRNRNRVATLQLCLGQRCLIFQIFHAGYIPHSLKSFLTNRDYTFVGVGIEADKQKLREDYDLRVGRCVDLTVYSKRGNLELMSLAYEFLPVRFEQPSDVKLSDWQAECLTPAQVKYASVNAVASYDIGMKCEKKIFTKASMVLPPKNPNNVRHGSAASSINRSSQAMSCCFLRGFHLLFLLLLVPTLLLSLLNAQWE